MEARSRRPVVLNTNTVSDTASSALITTAQHGFDSSMPAAEQSSGLSVGSTVGDYQIVRELGRGGMGVVYEAYDLRRDEQVALKTVKRVDPAAVYRFKKEFRALADIAHPNLVTLYELVSDGDLWFFTMKLIQGVPFLKHVVGTDSGPDVDTAPTNAELTQAEPDGQFIETRVATGLKSPQLTRLRESMRQLAEGVLALHAAGKLHRDIKTSNVMVSHDGRVVLLDFGLAAELGRENLHENTGQHVLGTFAYMSPEQAACQPLSPASDWYSVGVMLYEALTGHLPFSGSGWDMLANKQQRNPPSPMSLIPGVPDDLNKLCMEMLAREPAVRPSGSDILLRLGGESPASAPAPRPDRSARLPLVGREQHLAALQEAFRTTQRGRPVTMLIQGKSGAGKSALVQHFLDEMDDRDETVVLAGRCYEQESVPFKAFDAVVDSLARYLQQLNQFDVPALLPRDVQSLARLFPTLRCVAAIAEAPQRLFEVPDPHELRRRAFVALRELLARIGDRKPLIVFIDDLQWGDVDSARLLGDLLAPPDAPLLLFLGTYRSEDVDRSQFLSLVLAPESTSHRSLEFRDLMVEALSETEAQDLAISLIGSRDAAARELAATLARESGGNPFFVYELVQALKATNLSADRAFSSETISLDKILWERVQRLAEKPRRFLELVAVAGRPVALAEVSQAGELGSDERAALVELRTNRLVRSTGSGDQVEVEAYHDRIRESVVAHLSAEALQSHHRRFATVLDVSGHADPEVLAVHFQGAHEFTRAGACYAIAGDQAAEALAFEHSAKLYRLALDLNPADQESRRLLHQKLGAALANAGRGAEAAQHFLIAVDGASSEEQLELQRRAAEQFLISGHIDEGLAAFRTVLNAIGLELAPTPNRALVSLLIRRAQLWLRGLRFQKRTEADIPADELRRIDILWSVAHSLSVIDPIRSADFQTRNLLLSLRAGEPYRVCRALMMEAMHVSTAGRSAIADAAKLHGLAGQLSEQLDHPHTRGLRLLALGVTAYLQGRWSECLNLCDQAETHLRERCTGVAWELGTAQGFGAYALFFMGELAELARRWPAISRSIRDRGDLYVLSHLGTFTTPFLQLADDDPVSARRELLSVMRHWARHGFRVHDINGRGRQVEIALYTGRGSEAWRRIMRFWPDLQKSLLLRVQHLRIYMPFLHARCALAAASQSQHPEQHLRVAARDARQLADEGVIWSTALANMIQAGLAVTRGNPAAAMPLLRSAADNLESVEMRLYSNVARRRLGELIGGDEGHNLIAQADQWMASQNIQNPARMTAMLAPGFFS